jgi:homoserine kinase
MPNRRRALAGPQIAQIRVPGSSANLGSGFDALGLALDVHLEVRVKPRGETRVKLRGSCTEGLPSGDSNLIWRAFKKTWPEAPDLTLEVRNEIPLARGLGSSGAAAVAGVALAGVMGGLKLSPLEVLARAAEIEGHPDNVAASTLGGLAVVAGGRAVTLPWPREVGLLVAIPECRLATERARAVLPGTYTRADAVFNVQRAALLVAAVAAGDLKALSAALDDRLHQPYRQPLAPGLREALGLRLPGLLGVTLSGAGPSLLAFVTDPAPAKAALAEIYRRLKIGAEVRSLAVAPQGAVCS